MAQAALSVKNTRAGGDLLEPMDGVCVRETWSGGLKVRGPCLAQAAAQRSGEPAHLQAGFYGKLLPHGSGPCQPRSLPSGGSMCSRWAKEPGWLLAPRPRACHGGL